MIWESIKFVTSALTLVAFLVAVAAWVYRHAILRRERLINSAPESERTALVDKALEFFQVDTTDLTKVQKYNLALEQIRTKAHQFKISAIVVSVVATFTFAISLYALHLTSPELPHNKPTIVLMDSTRAAVVYDQTTFAKSGRTNADEISEVLDDLGVQIIKENTNLTWSREEELLTINPDLIIIHLSCFYDETNVEDSERKFLTFLMYMEKSKAKFIVYSRGFHHTAENWRIHMLSQLPQLAGRIFTLEVPSGSVFGDAIIRRQLKQLVKEALSL